MTPALPTTTGRSSGAPRRAAWLPIAAGAMLLAAFGVAYWMGGFDGADEPASAPPTLQGTIASLRTAHPEWFGSFELLDAKFLASGAPIDGDRFADRPHATVATLRPTFTWSEPDAIERYEVTLYDGEGQKLWTRKTRKSTLAFPDTESALTPGTSYDWEVTGFGHDMRFSRRSFETITFENRNRFAAALRAVRDGPQGHQALVLAHVAIRLGLLQDATDLLAPLARAGDVDPLVQQTFEYLKRQ